MKKFIDKVFIFLAILLVFDMFFNFIPKKPKPIMPINTTLESYKMQMIELTLNPSKYVDLSFKDQFVHNFNQLINTQSLNQKDGFMFYLITFNFMLIISIHLVLLVKAIDFLIHFKYKKQ